MPYVMPAGHTSRRQSLGHESGVPAASGAHIRPLSDKVTCVLAFAAFPLSTSLTRGLCHC
jgi:hypothetical protein